MKHDLRGKLHAAASFELTQKVEPCLAFVIYQKIPY